MATFVFIHSSVRPYADGDCESDSLSASRKAQQAVDLKFKDIQCKCNEFQAHTARAQLCGLAGADIACWVTDLYIKMSSFHIHQLVRRILMRPCATPVRLNYHFYQLKDAHAHGGESGPCAHYAPR